MPESKRSFVDGMWRWDDEGLIENQSSQAEVRSLSPWTFLLPIGFVVGSLQVGLVTSYLLPMMSRWQGAPYVPTAHAKVSLIFNRLLGHISVEGKTVFDLGSGDGRICIEAAKRGMNATGFELNPLLVHYSWLSSRIQVSSSVFHKLQHPKTIHVCAGNRSKL